MKDILLFGKNPHLPALCVLCLILSLMLPLKALAGVCEMESSADIQKELVLQQQKAAVNAMELALGDSFSADIQQATDSVMNRVDGMSDHLSNTLDWLWNNWLQALKDMTKQLHAGIIDESRQYGSNYDSSGFSAAALKEQRTEIESRKLYQPTNQACQFDTTAKYLGSGKRVSSAVTTGYALDFNKLGNNNKNSPAASGTRSLQKSRWQIYQDKFCDKNSNNGSAGCTAANVRANMHILPSRTIFAKETIDLADADTQTAVSQLMSNIIGYDIPDPIPVGALKSAAGLQQRQTNREFLAQMDAVGSLVWSVVADRSPGLPAPEVQALRQKMGVTDASSNPSAREIRQSVMEQLWDPNYYKELYDSPATIPQKELYLKAYGLVMLHDMIAKQERISAVYAIETANMLDKNDDSRHNASASAPLKP